MNKYLVMTFGVVLLLSMVLFGFWFYQNLMSERTRTINNISSQDSFLKKISIDKQGNIKGDYGELGVTAIRYLRLTEYKKVGTNLYRIVFSYRNQSGTPRNVTFNTLRNLLSEKEIGNTYDVYVFHLVKREDTSHGKILNSNKNAQNEIGPKFGDIVVTYEDIVAKLQLDMPVFSENELLVGRAEAT